MNTHLTPSEILGQLATQDTTWIEKAEWRQENKEWLDHSAKIALKVLNTLRQNRMEGLFPSSQKELAELMSISPQHINKIVKGSENLTLETITRLEKALNVQLIEVCRTFETVSVIEIQNTIIQSNHSGYIAHAIKSATELRQASPIQAENTSYAMAA